jgi:uncharacterized membrane protein
MILFRKPHILFGAVAAVLTGNQADAAAELITGKGNSVILDAVSVHETYANISLWFFAGILLLKTYFLIKKKFTGWKKFFIVLLALIGSYFIFETGLKGGDLVFKYGVGTDIINSDQSNHIK